jgi:hypothetical protein
MQKRELKLLRAMLEHADISVESIPTESIDPFERPTPYDLLRALADHQGLYYQVLFLKNLYAALISDVSFF